MKQVVGGSAPGEVRTVAVMVPLGVEVQEGMVGGWLVVVLFWVEDECQV